MRKFRFYIDLEKEEKWLNEMAMQGWELTGKSLQYEFRKMTSKETVVKIDYRHFKTKDDFEEYITLFRDSGWAHIAGTKTAGKQYFKKINRGGDTDIFSDVPSKAARYKRLSDVCLWAAISCMVFFIPLITTKAINSAVLLNPKLLYFTPGLWEKTGAAFWQAFLFETPFAVMRGAGWFFFPIMIILYVVFVLKAQKLYRRTRDGSLF
ncbi:MAG: DUF2812 domain-containing protein [Firmicutes bacterium]|nr:DUF2812 domain-containing protein [Bacillota bacterium]